MTIKLTPEQEAENAKLDAEYQKITKLSAFAVIETIEERTETHNHRRIDPTKPATADNVTYDVKKLGWFARVGGSSAIYVGDKEPPAAFKRGARIKISIELADEPPKACPEPVAPAVTPKTPVDHAANFGGEATARAAAFRGDVAAVSTRDD